MYRIVCKMIESSIFNDYRTEIVQITKVGYIFISKLDTTASSNYVHEIQIFEIQTITLAIKQSKYDHEESYKLLRHITIDTKY